MNSNYQNMCENAFRIQEMTPQEAINVGEGYESANGFVWVPSLDDLRNLIRGNTRKMWGWRFGEGDETISAKNH